MEETEGRRKRKTKTGTIWRGKGKTEAHSVLSGERVIR